MKTKAFFEKDFFNRGLDAQRKYPNEEFCRFLAKYKKKIKKGHLKCLEVGVGSGANLSPMLDFKLDVDAIDISKTAIELIKKEKKYKKVTFEELDMLEIDKKKIRYNFIFDIFSSYSMNTSNGKIFLKKVFKSLKKNGIFFSYFPCKKSSTWERSSKKNRIDKNTLLKIDDKNLPYYGNNYPFRFHSKKEYLKMLRSAGFKIKSCETLTKTYQNEKVKSVFLIVEGQK